MNKTRFILILAGLAALLMLPSGCTRLPAVSGPDEGIGVSLALSVGVARQSGTKMTESITQHNLDPSSFRGIDRVFILPFHTAQPGAQVSAGAYLWDYRLALPQAGLTATFRDDTYGNSGLIYNNYAHLYDHVFLRPETDAVLVYGKAPDATAETSGEVSARQRNGGLVAPDFDEIESTGDIVFFPDPISSNNNSSPKYAAVPWRDDLITNYLNKILTAKASRSGTPTYYFNMPSGYDNHPGLVEALEAFTNKGMYFPLSAEVLEARLTKLYNALYPLSIDPALSADYYYLPKNGAAYPYVYELAKAVVKTIFDDTKTNDQNTYTTRSGSGNYTIRLKTKGPVVFGLPAGTYAIQWQEGSTSANRVFKNLYNIDSDGHYDGLGYIPSDEFCYPPSLWYYANSPLISTTDEEVTQNYNKEHSWSQLQGCYPDQGVAAGSKAAAVRDPVQYGVALLELKIQKATTVKVGGKQTLEDFAGTPIDVGNTKFPLTGIIIADQYPQAFDFTPLPDEDTRARMYYMYDPEVKDANGNARAWLSQTTVSAVLTSLVLPTRPGADVRFALEFLNNTSYTVITGANGCVIPVGQHFYLAGILKFSERTDNSGENLASVFVRDHVTEIKAGFTSLKAAYDVIPDLTDPQLQLGVQAEFGWQLSTPTQVPIVVQ